MSLVPKSAHPALAAQNAGVGEPNTAVTASFPLQLDSVRPIGGPLLES